MSYRDNEGNVPAHIGVPEYLAWRIGYDAEREVRLAATQSELPRWAFYTFAFIVGLTGWMAFFVGGIAYLFWGIAGTVAIVGAVVIGCAVTMALIVRYVGIPLAAWCELQQAVPVHLKKAHAYVSAGHPVN